MKKLLVIFMALCLSFVTVSCGKKETNKITDSTSTETAKDTVFSGNTNSTWKTVLEEKLWVACEAYISFLRCTQEKEKIPEADIKTVVNETKKVIFWINTKEARKAYCINSMEDYAKNKPWFVDWCLQDKEVYNRAD